MVLTMNSKEILWPDKQLTDQIQKAKKIQRRTLSRRPLWLDPAGPLLKSGQEKLRARVLVNSFSMIKLGAKQ